MYENLIAQLRDPFNNGGTIRGMRMRQEAADAIENLQKQNKAQQDIIEKLKIRMEQTQAELDGGDEQEPYRLAPIPGAWMPRP